MQKGSWDGRQRAAARRAREEALRRGLEIEHRRLCSKQGFKEIKAMWKTMKMVQRTMARRIQIYRKMRRVVKVSWAGF